MFSNMNHFHSLNSMEGTFNPYFHGITPLASDKVPGYHHHHPQPTLTCLFNDEVPTQIGPSSLPNIDPGSQFFPSGHGCTGSNMTSEPEIQVNSFSSGSITGYVVPSKVHKMHQVQNYCGKKRKRMGEGEMEKPREVVHVRAKRGQATDSHSLAERLRREKINEKLRCLQDLVPGCYKTMGMAVMLDVIINYVRSLQNQIDFLSMKMSAASLFYDFNSSEAEALETMRVNTGGYDAEQGMDRTDGEGYGTIPNYYQLPWSL